MPKIYFAMPIDNGYKRQWDHCCRNLRLDPPCDILEHEIIGDSLVSRARNSLSAAFLKTDCTHLLFIDSDMTFYPEDVAKMLAHDLPIIAGFYPKKQAELAWVMNALPNEGPDARGLQKVRYAGTGFMLIARGVFERMRDEFPELAYHPDSDPKGTEWDFWQVGVYHSKIDGFRRYLSEDWFFCQRCLDMGIPVYMDTSIVAEHIGEVAFPLPDQRHKYLQAAPIPGPRSEIVRDYTKYSDEQ